MVGFAPTSSGPPTVLLVSTDSRVVDLLESARNLAPHFRLELCSDFEQVQPFFHREDTALVIVDVSAAADRAAVKDMLWAVMQLDPPLRTLLLLEEYDESHCVEFKRAGATCCRPRTVSELNLASVLEALTFDGCTVGLETAETHQANKDSPNPDPSFYICPQIEEMMKKVRRVAPQDTTILLTGETGTGKTHLAKFIHQLSPRRDESFKIVECSSLSPTLIESQLFGHVRGAFNNAIRDSPGKLAAAGRGTLVLDEINSLPLDLQCKLLRAVEERVFEPVGSNNTQALQARLIAISNSPLEEEVAAGRFRRDLYYRLAVVRFQLPPLRECGNAISPLAQRFLALFANKQGRDMSGIESHALQALEAFNWPGNVRELRSVIECVVSTSAGSQVELDDLPPSMRDSYARQHPMPAGNGEYAKEPTTLPMPNVVAGQGADLTLEKTKENAEIARIIEALRKHGNNRLRAAAELGISRMALYKKLHKYKIGPNSATHTKPTEPLVRICVNAAVVLRKRVLVTGRITGSLGRKSVVRSELMGDYWEVEAAAANGTGAPTPNDLHVDGKCNFSFRALKDIRKIGGGEVFLGGHQPNINAAHA